MLLGVTTINLHASVIMAEVIVIVLLTKLSHQRQ